MYHSGTRSHRTALSLAALLLILVLPACGGGGGGGGAVGTPAPTPTLTISGTAAATGLVQFAGGRDVGGGMIEIDIVMDGDILNQDVHDFVFDILPGDPSILDTTFVSSAKGTALDPSSTSLAASWSTNGANQVITVGFSILGVPGDNSITGTGVLICTITLKVAAVGSSSLSFIGAPNPVALDSTGAVVGAITYDTVAATVSGS
ncbi:MAG: hypothetical protein ACE5IK_10155 [Acidobacteriota bacterium]